MFFFLQTQPSSDGMFNLEYKDDDEQVEFDEEGPVRDLVSHLPSSGMFLCFMYDTVWSTLSFTICTLYSKIQLVPTKINGLS